VKYFAPALLIFATGVSIATLADPGGSCHFHGSKPASEATVLKCAEQRKAGLLKEGKLEKSWAQIRHESVALVDGKKGKEWQVVYRNPSASDRQRASLYLFFTPPGNFIAANHTGQ